MGLINSPNQACWSPWTSMASPKSASLTAAPLLLLASRRFSGCKTAQKRGSRTQPGRVNGGLDEAIPAAGSEEPVVAMARQARQPGPMAMVRPGQHQRTGQVSGTGRAGPMQVQCNGRARPVAWSGRAGVNGRTLPVATVVRPLAMARHGMWQRINAK